MNFPNYFADAESSFKESKFVIFGLPYDKTSSFRHGAAEAPKYIRQASWNFETYNMLTGGDLTGIPIHDYGDLDISGMNPSDMVKTVKDFTAYILKNNKFPVAIGGEHSVTSGIIQAYPDDIAVVVLDAHMDFRDIYENEKFNHACVTKRISDHLKIENIALIGIRSAEKNEYNDAEEKKLFYKTSFEIREKGMKKTLTEIDKHIGDKRTYLSFDIDALDPCYAPGTSTPEPFGISSFDGLEIIDFFSDRLVGFDIVEVCPHFDNGETSLIAAKYIRYLIEKSFI